MVWKKARKKPVIIEFREVEPDDDVTNCERIQTKEGILTARNDQDFVIRGIEGELYSIDKKIFEKTYDVIE